MSLLSWRLSQFIKCDSMRFVDVTYARTEEGEMENMAHGDNYPERAHPQRFGWSEEYFGFTCLCTRRCHPSLLENSPPGWIDLESCFHHH